MRANCRAAAVVCDPDVQGCFWSECRSPRPIACAGPGFHKAYVDLLRDTGRMSAEDVRAMATHMAAIHCSFSPGMDRISCAPM